jgi:hypothetical protein
MIHLDMCVHSVPTENTSTQDQIIFRDTLGFITWTKTRTIHNFEMYSPRDPKAQAEVDAAEVELARDIPRYCLRVTQWDTISQSSGKQNFTIFRKFSILGLLVWRNGENYYGAAAGIAAQV